MRSGSTRSGAGLGPIASIPFSVCRVVSRPSGGKSARRVGAPMPRLTTAPSGMSCAMRRARSSRLMRVAMSVLLAGGGGLERGALHGDAADELAVLEPRAGPDLDDAVDVDAGGDDRLGVERAERHDLVDLHDGRGGGARHDGSEVARGLAVDEVAPAVGGEGADEGEVGPDGVLEHVVAAVDAARLAAFGELGAVAGRRVEGADAGAGGADAFGEVALGHEPEFDLAGAVEPVEDPRVALAGDGAHDLAHGPRVEQGGEARVAVAGVVVDDREVTRPAGDERV